MFVNVLRFGKIFNVFLPLNLFNCVLFWSQISSLWCNVKQMIKKFPILTYFELWYNYLEQRVLFALLYESPTQQVPDDLIPKIAVQREISCSNMPFHNFFADKVKV